MVSLAVVLLSSSLARANVPSGFSVQSVLRDNAGKLQSMMVSVSVSLFDAQTMGNKLAGPYGPTMVMATNGLFTFPVTDASLQTELAGAAQVWLEVTVGSDIFARQQVTPQLYALMCGTADVANSMPNVSAVSGRVGIGTTSPLKLLDVQKAGTGGGAIVAFEQPGVPDGSSVQMYLGRSDGTNLAGVISYYPDATLANSTLRLGLYGPTTGLTINGSGNVGINTATPRTPLDVNGGIAWGGNLGGADLTPFEGWGGLLGFNRTAGGAETDFFSFPNTTSASGGMNFYNRYPGGPDNLLLRLASNGYVGIGTSSPAYPLDVSGIIRGTNVSPSDARLKTNVRPIEHALDDVERLRGVRFDWKKDGTHSIGVVAQEVEKVYPELVSTADYKSVDYAKLTAVLIEATKALHAENAALKARLDRMEARLNQRAAR
jgi:hypothetical protein